MFAGAGVPRAVGIEPDAADAELARASGAYERVHRASGDAVPEPDGAFDVAFSNSTLEHIPDLDAVVREMSRLVRSGGRVVITVPSEQFHDCLRGSAVLGSLARRRGLTYRSAVDDRLAHRHYLDPAGWRALLARHGFTDARHERYLPRAAVRTWESLSNATAGILYELFGGRRSTRRLQRGLGLVRRASAVERIVVGALERSRALDAEVEPGVPSGGLLVMARRA